MVQDFLSALRYFRGVDSNAPDVTLGRGRRVVGRYIPILAFLLVLAVGFGFIKVPDGLLLSVYGVAPFILDSTLFLEAVPLVSRVLPRATFLIHLGADGAALGLGISLSIVYAIYRKVGAASMTLSWYLWKRRD